jgi:hypothetical protein
MPSPRLIPLPPPRSKPADVEAAERDGPSAQAVLRGHDGKPWWWPKSLSLQKRGQKIQQNETMAKKLEWEQRWSEKHQRPYWVRWVERHQRQVVWRDPHVDKSRTQQSEPEPESEPEPAGSQYAAPAASDVPTGSRVVAAAKQEALGNAKTPFRMLVVSLARPTPRSAAAPTDNHVPAVQSSTSESAASESTAAVLCPQDEQAVTKIQAVQRGRNARAEVAQMRGKALQGIQNEQAIAKIQAVQRGRHARAEVAQMRAEAAQEPVADATLAAQFIQAADRGDTAAVADLLGPHRVPVNSTADSGGGSALQYAAQKNHTETVRASIRTILSIAC